MPFFRVVEGGVELHVRLTPRGGADAIEGVETTADGKAHLKARVRAVPEKGAANAALAKLVAAWLGVPRRDVTLAAGATARLKTLRVAGDPAMLAERLRQLA
jgi:uncharacterized protein YggU (UPF0235/DUF167 family)